MRDFSTGHGSSRRSAADILASRLRRLRTGRSLTQRKMALALGLGAHSNIADYESGRRLPHNDILIAYERYFSIPGSELQRLRERAIAARARSEERDAAAAGWLSQCPAPHGSQISPLVSGDLRELGEFRLIGRLGSGALGQTYLALTSHMRPVAVKVASPELAADQSFRSRLADGLTALGTIRSSRLTSVISADTDDEKPWVALSYIHGPSLGEVIGMHGPFPAAVVRGLAMGIAEAVIHLHSVGVCHLGLRPTKIRLADEGPVIIDYGFGHAAVGTRCPSEDVLAIGILLGYAVTGILPSDRESPDELYRRVVSAQRCPDRKLAELINECLSRNPGSRPDLSRIVEGLADGRAGTSHVGLPAATVTPRADRDKQVTKALPGWVTKRRIGVPALGVGLCLAGSLSALVVVALIAMPSHRQAVQRPASLNAGSALVTADSYDQYGCVGQHDVPATVRLDPPGNPRDTGWQSSTPRPWDTPYCTAQIWWTPYVNSGANPLIRFGWTFMTSIPHLATCTVWAYYPPPPSGHSGGTARYSIYDAAAQPRRLATVLVDQARYKGTWHELGAYRISRGLIKVVLDNSGNDPDPEQGPIAGPIHVSCTQGGPGAEPHG